MTDTKDKTLPEIGYLYFYPRMEHPTEKFRLDVFISATPTEQHFDVLQFHCFVKNQRGIKVTISLSISVVESNVQKSNFE